MTEWINEYYSWIKWVHYLVFVSWMAGLSHLPCLFVYRAENKNNKGSVDVVKIQERRLYFGIQDPAMIATIINGSLMLHAHKEVSMVDSDFIHTKLTCATLSVISHIHNYSYLKALADDTFTKGRRYFRTYGEFSTLMFIIIALMMVIRPS